MSSHINIAALVPYKVYPAKMGGQKGIACFYEYLSRLVPVTIISTKNNEFPADSEATFLPMLSNSRSRYMNPGLFFSMKNVLRKKNITHLIIEHPYFGWLGLLLKSFCKVRLVVHSHNIEALRFRSTGKWWWRILFNYEKLTHRNADINFFISDEDKTFAIREFNLAPPRCHTITYGFDLNGSPTQQQRIDAAAALRSLHGIAGNEKIFFFNGTLDYPPNLDAVDIILREINPRLLADSSFKYKIIICGKNLPGIYNELREYKTENIIYAGFVDDISLYFRGADCFINPVTDGGGIKTKLVEALGNNLSSVSTVSGAIGVNHDITGNKLKITSDGDWDGFTNAIFETDMAATIPPEFFQHFYWGNIAGKAATILNADKISNH